MLDGEFRIGDEQWYRQNHTAWGHGAIKIVELCLEQELPEPDFSEENGVMTVTFYKDKWNKEDLKKIGLTERQIKTVMYVKTNGRITNIECQKLLEISKRTATNDLDELVQKGLFEKTGTRGPRTYYKIKNGNNWILWPLPAIGYPFSYEGQGQAWGPAPCITRKPWSTC